MENTFIPVKEVSSHHIQTQQGRLYAQCWPVSHESTDTSIPLILFHDSLGCIPLWRDFPKKLATVTGQPVIAYDRLGFGRSDPHPGQLTADFINHEIEHTLPCLLDAFGVDRFIACGHSVGGAMAVVSAARFPAACKGLMTMGAQVFVEELTLSGIRKAKEEFAKPENLARLDKYHGDKSRWVVDAWTDTWLSREFSEWHVRDELARISCPVLAIHGDIDPYGSTEHALVIAADRGVVEILKGIGHVPYREAEEQTLDIIRSFVSKIKA